MDNLMEDHQTWILSYPGGVKTFTDRRDMDTFLSKTLGYSEAQLERGAQLAVWAANYKEKIAAIGQQLGLSAEEVSAQQTTAANIIDEAGIMHRQMLLKHRAMKITKQDTYFVLSLIFAIWFALTSYLWVYFVNLIISLPFGILSFIFWRSGRKKDQRVKRNKIIPIIWAIGVITAAVVLIAYLIYS